DLICKDKRKQKRPKNRQEMKRQNKSEEWKPISKAGSARNKKRKSMKLKLKSKDQY
ncbi:hypothetical protein Tco_1392981, partial [Tanacetum coccineum]